MSEQLVAWARVALRDSGRRSGDPPPRILDAELLHITLCFLGNRPAEEIEAIGARLAECDGPTSELSVGAPLWLPPRRPRALAVELHDEQGRLTLLQKSVVVAMGHMGNGQPTAQGHTGVQTKHRHFRPHVTVARMRSARSSHERMLPPTPALSFVPNELILYRSWLSPEGASYEALASHKIR
jgi:RNA 2',3'-cyclic 3'-phosphodiesterase